MLFLDLLLLLKLTVSVRRWNTSDITSNKNMVVASKMLRKTPVEMSSNITDREKYLSRLPNNSKKIYSDLAMFRSIYLTRFMDINSIKQEKSAFEIIAKFYRNHLNFQRSNLDERSTDEKIYSGDKQVRNKQTTYHNGISEHFHGIRPVKQPNKQMIEYFLTKYSQDHANRLQDYHKKYKWAFQISSVFNAILENKFRNFKSKIQDFIFHPVLLANKLEQYCGDRRKNVTSKTTPNRCLEHLENIVKYMLDFDLMVKKEHNCNSDPKISTGLPSLGEVLPDNTTYFLVLEGREKIKPLEYSETNMISESIEHTGITGPRVFADATGSKKLPEHTALNIISEESTSDKTQHIASSNLPIYSPSNTNELSTENDNTRPSSFSFVTRLLSLSKPIHHISLQVNKCHSLMFTSDHAAGLTSNKKQHISALKNKIILRKLLHSLYRKELLKFKEAEFISKYTYGVILFPKYTSRASNSLIHLVFQSKHIPVLMVIFTSDHVRRRSKQFWQSLYFNNAHRQIQETSKYMTFLITDRFSVLVSITHLIFKYKTIIIISWINSNSRSHKPVAANSPFGSIQYNFSIILLFRQSRNKYLEETFSSFAGRKLLFSADSSNSALIRRLIKRDVSPLKSSQLLTSLKLKQTFSTISNDQTTPDVTASSLKHPPAVFTSTEFTTRLRSSMERLPSFSNATETPTESMNFVNSSTINSTQNVGLNITFNVVDIIIQPAILFTGIIGNIISILVFRSKDFKNEVAFYIPVFLSIIELFTGINVFFDSAFYIYFFGGKVSNLNFSVCKTFHYVKVLVKSTSSWAVALMSTERFIAVRFPFKAKIYITKYKVLSALIVCFLVEAIFSSLQISTKSYENGTCVKVKDSNMLLVIIMLFNSWLIPSLTIVILNALTIIELRRQNRIRKTLSINDRNQEFRQINLMLFTIIICKFIFELPVIIQHIFLWIRFESSNLLSSTFIALGIVQHSANAFLYSFISKSFRSVILNCFRNKA